MTQEQKTEVPTPLQEQMTAENFERLIDEARTEARQKGIENPKVRMRRWNAVRVGTANMGEALNQLEDQGWNLVNILTNGAGSFVVVSARILEFELPPEEVEPLKDETSPEAAPDSLTEDELARQRWAEETGGGAGEAGAHSEEVQ